MRRIGKREISDRNGVADVHNLVRGQVGVRLDDAHQPVELDLRRANAAMCTGFFADPKGGAYAKIQLREIVDGALEVGDGGNNVEALVDPCAAHSLAPSTRPVVIDQLEQHFLAPGK